MTPAAAQTPCGFMAAFVSFYFAVTLFAFEATVQLKLLKLF